MSKSTPRRFHIPHWQIARNAALMVIGIGVALAIPYLNKGDQPVNTGSTIAFGNSTRLVKVASTAALRLVLPSDVDHASAAEHLMKPEGVEGEVTWDEDTLVFTPVQPLTLGEQYEFTLPTQTQRLGGKRLLKPLTYVFDVAGDPEPSTLLPVADSTDVPVDGVISITFDRPMISLGAIQKSNDAAADWPGTISPATDGRWRWLGTSTIEFRPTERLDYATAYTISVPAGLTTPAGDSTSAPVQWTFSTEQPRLTGSDPYDGGISGPTDAIVLNFSVPMDPTRIGDGIHLETEAGDRLAATVLHPKPDDDGNIDTRMLVVTPASALPLDAPYAVVIKAGTNAAEGDLGTADDTKVSFRTPAPLQIEEINGTIYNMYVNTNTPITAEALEKNLTLDPPVADLNIGDWFGDEGTTSLYLYPALQPGTTYTATVAGGLTDVYGQKLGDTYTTTFTTPDLDPEVYIHSKGDFGIFERGKAPVYYLNSLNVSELNVRLGRMDLADFLQQQDQYENYNLSEQIGQWTLPVDADKNNWDIIPFDLEEKTDSSLTAGLYQLLVQAPEYTDYQNQPVIQRQYFALTNLAVTMKYTDTEVLVWVVNNQTGAPVNNASIALYDQNSQQEAAGSTDSSGMARIPIDISAFISGGNTYDPVFWGVVRTADDTAYVSSRWVNGTEAYNFGYFSDYRGPDTPDYTSINYVYTERPLYKAGQRVYFKGVSRLRDNNGTLYPTVSPKRTANVTIRDAEDREVYNETLNLNSFGSFSGSFLLDENASLGTYWLQTTILPEDDIRPQYDSSTFQVLAYRKPEHRVDVSFGAEEYFAGDTVQASVEAAYYFGTAMDKAAVTWRALLTDYSFNQYRGDKWYYFDDVDWCYYDCNKEESGYLTEGEGTTDRDGQLELEIPVTLDGKDSSQILTLEADVVDDSNQLVSNRASVPVHQSAVYIGLRALSYGVPAGDKVPVEAIAVDTSGTPLNNQSVTFTLLKREWTTIRKKDVDGDYYWDNQHTDTYVSDTTVRTNQDGTIQTELLLPEGGEFRIIASSKDSKGRENKAGLSTYAYSTTYVNWPRTNSDRLEMIVDKPSYNVGDTATIIAKAPYQGEGVKAWVTIEREQVMESYVVDVTDNAVPIEVKITEDMIPNAYVSVVLVKPRDGETFDEQGRDTGVPAFKMGLEKLIVEPERKTLQVEIKTDAERYLPRAQVTATITTKNWQGNPAPGEVSLAVVDMSLLALSGFSEPDLVANFYTQRGLSVRTSHLLLQLLERFKPGSKGGGGFGDAEGKRGEFKDTAYWNPSIVTNDDGTATVQFQLPDNLTTWQLLAIANTKDSRFGTEAIEIIETKDVIVRPVRPRFAVMGDQIELAAIVHNETEEQQQFTVRLSGTGFTPDDDTELTVTIGAGERKTLPFPVTVTGTSALTLNFAAESPAGRDEVEETIPIELFTVPQAVATAGVVDESATETLYVPSEDDARDVRLTANLSATVGSYLPGGLSYVVHYPYGCAEQIMSGFLPSVAIKKLQAQADFGILTDSELDDRVTTGLQKLYELQTGNGGFGFWADSTEPNPVISAYIVYGLYQAEEAGYTVDDGVLQQGRSYLETVLSSPDMYPGKSDALTAQILFTLQETGGVDAGRLRAFSDKWKDLPFFAKAFYLLALQPESSVRDITSDVENDLLNNLRVSERTAQFSDDSAYGYGWYFNTGDRSTALGAMALSRSSNPPAALPRLIRYLLSIRENGHWDTTQSTVYSILALLDYMETTGELDADFTATLALDGSNVDNYTVNDDNILSRRSVSLPLDSIARETDTALQIAKNGQGLLYYDLVLQYNWSNPALPAEEAGFSITKTVTPVGSTQPLETGDELEAGQNYRVEIVINAPEDRHAVAVESPLAAGTEALDPNLQINSVYDQDQQVNNRVQEYGWWWWQPFTHTEYRDDRVFLFADNLPAGVYRYEYIMRATVGGTYLLRPTRVWEMYFPEHFAHTAGETVTISGE